MRTRFGFSALEMLIVVSIVGILVGVGFVRLRPPTGYLYANDLKALLMQAKFEAVKRDMPVAVVWNAASKSFQTRIDPANTDYNGYLSACTNTSAAGLLRRKATTDYADVTVTGSLVTTGVVWLPNGLLRSCGAAGTLPSGTTTITGSNNKNFNLNVTAVGQITIRGA